MIPEFRAWDIKREVMENCIEISPFHIGDCDRRRWKPEEVVLMQYTGLKDRKGKKIFVGDIIKQTYHKVSGSYDDYETFSGHHIGRVVITATKGACMKNPLNYSDEAEEVSVSKQYKTISSRRCEVIGNFHLNPELLEVKA